MKSGYTFPWRNQNSFQLLIDSKVFYPHMLAAIEAAQDFVFLEQYLVSSGMILDQFILALTKSAQRGVKIFILFDDYGTKMVNQSDLNRLKQKNIYFVSYNPFHWKKLYSSLRRNHRKLLLIDNHIAFVGGAGLADVFISTQNRLDNTEKMNWHDIVLEIRGQVVYDWYQSFAQIWQKCSSISLPEPVGKNLSAELTQSGRVLLSKGPGRNAIIKSALRNIRKSTQHVWIATPYFLTTRKLRHALSNAAKRNVDVRLLLPGPISDHSWISYAARRYYRRLLRNGVKIFEYQPRFLHAKIILADDWISIGSSNLDRWNQFWNLDANQAIRDENLVQQTLQLFQTDFEQSELLTYPVWKQRPWPQRFSEWWASYAVRLIQWLVYLASRMRK